MTSSVSPLLWSSPFASSSRSSLLSPLKPSISKEDDLIATSFSQLMNSFINIYTYTKPNQPIYLFVYWRFHFHTPNMLGIAANFLPLLHVIRINKSFVLCVIYLLMCICIYKTISILQARLASHFPPSLMYLSMSVASSLYASDGVPQR